MIEVVLAVAIVGLSAAGLGAGLLMGRGPAQTSCGAATCLPKDRCNDCPLRRAANDGKEPRQ